MKKIYGIVIANLIILFIIFLTLDIFCFIKDVNLNSRFYVYKTPETFIKTYLRTYKRMFYDKKNYDTAYIEGKGANIFFRPVLNKDSEEKPILIMGCSFAYGSALTVEQSFMGKLTQFTKKPIYNRAIAARGADEMLYQLQSDKFYSIIPKPEWFIYVFISDQVRRTQIPCSVVDTGVYYDKNMKIRRDITFPLIYALKNKIAYYSHDKYISHFCNIMKQMKSEAQKHWGDDVKFVFIFYENDEKLRPEMKETLENSGFIFYSLNDLTSVNLMTPKYKAEDKVHPSESAWDILTPIIAEKLGI